MVVLRSGVHPKYGPWAVLGVDSLEVTNVSWITRTAQQVAVGHRWNSAVPVNLVVFTEEWTTPEKQVVKVKKYKPE